MREAADRLGMATTMSAIRALRREGFTVRQIHPRAYVVESRDVDHYIELYGPSQGRGRPRKIDTSHNLPATT